MNPIATFLRKQEGITAISFAIIAPIMILLFIGVIELGLVLVIQNALEAGAREAARFSIVENPNSTMSREAAIREKVTEIILRFSAGLINQNALRFEVRAYNDLEVLGRPEPFEDLNNNGRYDEGEPYIDVNGNNRYDEDQGISGSFGVGGQAVQYKISYDWDTIIPLFRRDSSPLTLTGTAIVVNEDFTDNQ